MAPGARASRGAVLPADTGKKSLILKKIYGEGAERPVGRKNAGNEKKSFEIVSESVRTFALRIRAVRVFSRARGVRAR